MVIVDKFTVSPSLSDNNVCMYENFLSRKKNSQVFISGETLQESSGRCTLWNILIALPLPSLINWKEKGLQTKNPENEF
jgi:hypothetical protein